MVDRQHLISHRVLRSSKKIMIFYLWKIITFFKNIIIIFHTGKKDEDHLYIWVNIFHHNDYYYWFLFLFIYLFFFSKVEGGGGVRK